MSAPDPSSSTTDLVNRLAEELARRWHAGERPLVEEYLAQYPELANCAEAAAELIYEELCLRRELDPAANAEDVLGRFPQWRAQLEVLIQFHDLLEGAPAKLAYPAPGEGVGDFKLLAELGRGAHGRVFLATQGALADRPVVLKFVPRSGQEHLALARLQHTHIVPLYSMEDVPERGLRALCMPYFGGATLARVLERLQGQPLTERSGKALLQALADIQDTAPIRIPVDGPVCQFLARISYARSICWLGVCLAEALQYTHERGLLHLDIKPSNILWAADGQPMLLDLHLAKPPISAGDLGPTWLGGTPAYMAPEQRLAMAAIDAGQKVLAAVDGRADLYALGLVLVECLAGSLPQRGDKVSSWLVQRNRHVNGDLADILEKCLADQPRDRYASAAALAEALRRHLADRPKRAPVLRAPADASFHREPRRPYARMVFALAVTAFLGAGLALAYLYFERAQTTELRGQVRAADRAVALAELHQVVERLRVVDGAESRPGEAARALAEVCRAIWDKRALIARELEAPTAHEREQAHIDLLDLAILWSNLHTRVAEKNQSRTAHQESLDILDQAEALTGPSCVLDYDRRTHAAALGRPRTESSTVAPSTAWENLALGRAHLRDGDLDSAASYLEQALTLEPQGFWQNFLSGTCAYRRGRYDDTVLTFTACIVLAPDNAWCFYNRGLAYEALGQPERALADYDRSLRLEPALAAAALNRGMLHFRANRYAQALDDLARALAGGARAADVEFNRALVYLAQGNHDTARTCLRDALAHDPNHSAARTLAETLEQGESRENNRARHRN